MKSITIIRSANEIPRIKQDEFISIHEFINEHIAILNQNKESILGKSNLKRSTFEDNKSIPFKEINEENKTSTIKKENQYTESPSALTEDNVVKGPIIDESNQNVTNEELKKPIDEADNSNDIKVCAECDKKLLSPDEKNMLLCFDCMTESIKQEEIVEARKLEHPPWKCIKCNKLNMIMEYQCESKKIT